MVIKNDFHVLIKINFSWKIIKFSRSKTGEMAMFLLIQKWNLQKYISKPKWEHLYSLGVPWLWPNWCVYVPFKVLITYDQNKSSVECLLITRISYVMLMTITICHYNTPGGGDNIQILITYN